MVSITVRQTATFGAGILLLAAVVGTRAGFSQSRFGADADRRQQIVERIAQEEARGGPYSESLIAPLSDLALLYQDRGDHDLAVAVITRIRQVVRANEGLHSLEQIPLIQQMIANEEAIGRIDTAWELEQDLLTLARRHPGDIRTVPIFRETAAKRMALLRQYLAGESPPQMVLGCYFGWPREDFRGSTSVTTEGGCNSGTRDDAIRALVADALMNYADAITGMLRNGLYSSNELRELELDLLRSIDVFEEELRRSGVDNIRGREARNSGYSNLTTRSDLEPWHSFALAIGRLTAWTSEQRVTGEGLEQDEPGDVGTAQSVVGSTDAFAIGRQSLGRLLAYEIATAPLQDQVEAFVRIADWDLLHDASYAQALQKYQRAHEMLAAAGARASIDEIFAPRTPIVLPTFMPNPLARDQTQTATGYIDVAFEITLDGESRRIEILDTNTNATDADKTRLVQLIQSSRFRPRVTNGEFARASPVMLRYYLTE
jgi:hypothetical protein